jgi:hypothetical protein
MRLTDRLFDNLANTEIRWLVFESMLLVAWSDHQRERLERDRDLLQDVNRPRRRPTFLDTFPMDDVYDIPGARGRAGDIRRFATANTDWMEHLRVTAVPTFDEGVEIVEPDPPVRPRVDVEELRILHHDLELRYASCYFIKDDFIGFANGFYIEDDKIRLEYYKVVNGSLTNKTTAIYNDSFQFTLPNIGYINCDKFSLFSERSYRRDNSYKYKRGFTDYSCIYYSISDREIRATEIPYDENPDISPASLTKKVVYNIFLQKYPSYEEALESVLSFNRLSCAFSSTLCIKLDSLYNKFVLLKNTWTIAELNVKTGTWIILNSSFNEELTKLNIPFEVV